MPERSAALLVPPVLVLMAAPSTAQGVDDFEAGSNPSGWSFRVTTPDVVESTGGNPSGWLRNPLVDSFAPIVATAPGTPSPFTGDFRAQGVTRIGVDAITASASITAVGRNFTVLLRDTKGTTDPSDDDYAYSVGPLVPQVGAGWSSYVFDLPSASNDAVPAGWEGGWAGDPEDFRPGVEWSDVVTSVDVVEFWWIDPAFFALFQQWDVGIDNAFVETGLGTAACSPGVANSTGAIGTMSAVGSAVAALNDVTLIAGGLPPAVFGIFVNGQSAGAGVSPGGIGTLCVGAPLGRYDGPSEIMNSGPNGTFSLRLDLAQSPTNGAPVAVVAGQTWYFQAWHRDAVAGPVPARLTEGIAVTFQ